MDMRQHLKSLPGLKARDLKPALGGRGVAAQGPIFYRVTIEQFGIDRDAVTRQHGLELMTGSPALAAALGPDDDIAKRLQTSTVFVGMTDFFALPLCACLGESDDEPTGDDHG
ncbi:MAG: hypothetical protein V4659_04055 [Pseudomonadota bacterium]